MKNFSKHFGVIALIEVIALALAGCSPQVETVVVNSDGGANSIRKGDTISFSAAVTGKNNPSQNVKWSVSSKSDGSGAVADGTNISPSGTLIVDAKETASNIFVRATASQSADKFDYVQLKVEAASSAPRTATVSTATAQKTETAATTATPTTATPAASTTTATPTTTTPAASQSVATTISAPAASTSTSSGGFQMSGTTLTKYTGSNKSVTIPDGITSIGKGAFEGTGITSVIIPNSVTTIGQNAFNSNQLTSVTIPNSVTSIETGAFANNKLTSITIPNSVTKIGGYAFQENQLDSVIIPNSVKEIGNYAFWDNQLRSVTIPASVTTIGPAAFEENRLERVIFERSGLGISNYQMGVGVKLYPFNNGEQLAEVYNQGGAGTYIFEKPGRQNKLTTEQWRKQ